LIIALSSAFKDIGDKTVAALIAPAKLIAVFLKKSLLLVVSKDKELFSISKTSLFFKLTS
jgi:hypothetical protein